MGTFHVIAKETKEQILNRIKNEGVSVPQAAKDAGISNTTIYTWLDRTTQGQHNSAGVAGFEPATDGFGDRCATNCATPLSIVRL